MSATVTVTLRIAAVWTDGRRYPCERVKGSKTLEWLGGPCSHAVPVVVLWRDPGTGRALVQAMAEDLATVLGTWGYVNVTVEEEG